LRSLRDGKFGRISYNAVRQFLDKNNIGSEFQNFWICLDDQLWDYYDIILKFGDGEDRNLIYKVDYDNIIDCLVRNIRRGKFFYNIAHRFLIFRLFARKTDPRYIFR
jgi:hypothetical protein